MKFTTIFFDRDGTLTMNDPSWEKLKKDKLEEWSQKPYNETFDFFTKHFEIVKNAGYPFSHYKNVDQELQFFKQWYLSVFEDIGIIDQIEERAEFLINHLWYIKKQLYPETIKVLEYFKNKGFKMGVISDCPPSLEMTLKNVGIHNYFTSFSASSLVGAGKPSPIIFNDALNKLGVRAEECIFVDDTKNEADGAREQGFTSFYLDRTGECKEEWTIKSLDELIDFIENCNSNLNS